MKKIASINNSERSGIQNELRSIMTIFLHTTWYRQVFSAILVSDAFFKELTRLPELEIARDKVKVIPSAEYIDNLLQATPYAIGTEFIDKRWILDRFSELEE